MVRTIVLASITSLFVCGFAAAEPQTVSYFSGSCPPAGNNCVPVASVPAQGFVLTDIIFGISTDQNLFIEEVVGPNFIYKTQLPFTPNQRSYHLNSGIPFAGGSGIKLTINGASGLNDITLVGYIPGTNAFSVPAVGGLGLSVLTLLILGAGGYILRRSKLRFDADR
jgi:hypothetical protein